MFFAALDDGGCDQGCSAVYRKCDDRGSSSDVERVQELTEEGSVWLSFDVWVSLPFAAEDEKCGSRGDRRRLGNRIEMSMLENGILPRGFSSWEEEGERREGGGGPMDPQ